MNLDTWPGNRNVQKQEFSPIFLITMDEVSPIMGGESPCSTKVFIYLVNIY